MLLKLTVYVDLPVDDNTVVINHTLYPVKEALGVVKDEVVSNLNSVDLGVLLSYAVVVDNPTVEA
jgi:hypothetical protein